MHFKYIADFEKFVCLTDGEVVCGICHQSKKCMEDFTGSDDIGSICIECIYSKKLYGQSIFTNIGNPETLLSQIKECLPGLNDEEQLRLVNEKTMELEQATPGLITFQDMQWPCLDGDYARFIGYGSKPFYNDLAKNGDGKSLFQESLHPELQIFFTDSQWDQMLPDEMVPTFEESQYSPLVYVFKSLVTEQIIAWWDSI